MIVIYCSGFALRSFLCGIGSMRESLSRYDSDLLLGLRPALFYGIGSMRESLSRYDSDLLLGLRPALFYGIGSMLRIQIQVAQLKRLSSEGRFLFLSLVVQEGSRAD